MSTSRDQWIVIGISGVTCGGKTTLANKLKELLTPVHVFHQDKYFLPDDSPEHVRCAGIEHNNYDILSALDMPAMLRDVLATVQGSARAHASSTERRPGRLELRGRQFLVLEGFTALNYKPLLELCDLRYYIVLEYGECAARRALRLYEPPDVPGYFEQCVWPEHVRHRAEVERDGRVRLLDGARPDMFDAVVADVRALGACDVPA